MTKKKHMLTALVLIACLMLTACTSKPPAHTTTAPDIKNADNVAAEYDLIVMGGEPEGIAAAIAGAKSGMKTLLLSEQKDLGGLYTVGELNFIDIPETRTTGTSLVGGAYESFFNKVGGSAFDINTAKTVFYEMVTAEPNITLRVESRFKAPVMNGSAITGVTVEENGREVTYRAPYVIDATADANVAAAAGAPYTYAGEDIGEKDRHMGVTLVFELSGVDWTAVTSHLTVKRAKGEVAGGATDMGATGNTAWGYTREGYAYEPKDEAMRLRGFNIARQANGNVLINALIIFDVNVLDEASKAEGIARGQEELKHIVPYINKTFKGFEKAKLAGTAEMLYVRESRHIQSEYMLTIDDVMENRDQWDKVAVTNYPVDVQPTKEQTYGTVVGFPDQYAVSYRSLIPLKIDNLFVAGRAAGYQSMAAGSARIVPTGMACAEGAGVAASIAKARGVTPRALCNDRAAMSELQQKLTAMGAKLNHTQTYEPVIDHWAYSGVKTLRSLGLLDGGYVNDYKLDEAVTMNRYQNMINNVFKKAGFTPAEKILVNDNPPVRQILGTMARTIAAVEGDSLPNDNAVYAGYLQKRGILTDTLLPYFSDMEKNPNNAEVIMLTANCYRYLTTLPNAQQLTAVS